MTALERAAKIAGGFSQLASLIGVVPSAPINWKNRGTAIAPEYCVAIEKATKGKVTRKQLRPNDWRAIWPELDKAEA